ncbi:hypothetical protein VTL71DRAFT_2164 [Oculimacula yallundae]|uniref:Uncharacterized protein n=1 Tax=Oculimacula yallundae TaxID=86028 RepID=A0ABR4C843_9HELO
MNDNQATSTNIPTTPQGFNLHTHPYESDPVFAFGLLSKIDDDVHFSEDELERLDKLMSKYPTLGASVNEVTVLSPSTGGGPTTMKRPNAAMTQKLKLLSTIRVRGASVDQGPAISYSIESARDALIALNNTATGYLRSTIDSSTSNPLDQDHRYDILGLENGLKAQAIYTTIMQKGEELILIRGEDDPKVQKSLQEFAFELYNNDPATIKNDLRTLPFQPTMQMSLAANARKHVQVADHLPSPISNAANADRSSAQIINLLMDPYLQGNPAELLTGVCNPTMLAEAMQSVRNEILGTFSNLEKYSYETGTRESDPNTSNAPEDNGVDLKAAETMKIKETPSTHHSAADGINENITVALIPGDEAEMLDAEEEIEDQDREDNEVDFIVT